jgi:hypothetical protein
LERRGTDARLSLVVPAVAVTITSDPNCNRGIEREIGYCRKAVLAYVVVVGQCEMVESCRGVRLDLDTETVEHARAALR